MYPLFCWIFTYKTEHEFVTHVKEIGDFKYKRKIMLFFAYIVTVNLSKNRVK